jgi:lipoprotein-anchoring transpeptidase ErfK/SrfK
MKRFVLNPTMKSSKRGLQSALPTSAEILILLLISILLSGCSAPQEQPAVALALENRGQPFRTGVEIAKPTYTPVPTQTSTPVQSTVTAAPPLADTPTPAVFAEDAFVIIENLSAPASAGYDDTKPHDSPPAYNGTKYILVDISEQHMYVYEGDELVYSFIASTGIGNSTRVGTFSVLNKIPNAYGATWNIWMPNWLGIYWSGNLQNGIHALPILPNGATLWAGFLGTPVSYGCVVLGTHDAQVLYDWADIGTPVEIRW